MKLFRKKKWLWYMQGQTNRQMTTNIIRVPWFAIWIQNSKIARKPFLFTVLDCICLINCHLTFAKLNSHKNKAGLKLTKEKNICQPRRQKKIKRQWSRKHRFDFLYSPGSRLWYRRVTGAISDFRPRCLRRPICINGEKREVWQTRKYLGHINDIIKQKSEAPVA